VRRVSWPAIAIWGVVVVTPAAVAQEPAPAPQEGQTVEVVEETAIDRQVREIASQLRCPVCQGLSLQDSPSELAQEMRDVIRTRLESGETVDQVLAYFEQGYGEWILMEPKAEGFNLAVYLLPVLAVLGGGAFLFIAGRRWLAASPAGEAASDVAEQDPDLAAWDELVQR
jgi:cytochrome c-type biogenesis protein CcmH